MRSARQLYSHLPKHSRVIKSANALLNLASPQKSIVFSRYQSTIPNLSAFNTTKTVPQQYSISGIRKSAKSMASSSTQAAQTAAPQLPPLSVADQRVFDQMSETMEAYHNHFRHSWTILYNACTTNKRPQNMSLRQFLATGIQFCKQLAMHHGIEEQHIFPMLAVKMPEFQTPAQRKKNGTAGTQGGAAELIRQHEIIHEGMDGFEAYLHSVLDGEKELDLRKLKEQMDSWGEVLWLHLDEEVQTLKAENMRKYWTVQDMRRMAF